MEAKNKLEGLSVDDVLGDLLTDESTEYFDKIQEKYAMKEAKREEKIEIAKSMLDNDYDIEEISKITGLSKEEIENIK